jgi:hypothetical protein
MKKYLLIIICLLVSVCRAQQNNPFTPYTADKFLALKGAVRSLVIYNIKEETSGETTEEIYMRYFFTPEGAITHIISYNNGAEESVSYYKYDTEGKIRECSTQYASEGIIPTKTLFFYNRDNSIVKEKHFSEGQLLRMIEKHYNKKQQEEKQILYDDKEKVYSTIIYSYDTQGHQNQIENYDSSGKRINRTIRKFDEKGNIYESILYNEADQETRKIYFTYDKYNNITRRKIENIRPSPKTTVQTLRYEYDTHHNYIQETCLSGSEVLYTQKREISYYD